jgi:hypothetical protein
LFAEGKEGRKEMKGGSREVRIQKKKGLRKIKV